MLHASKHRELATIIARTLTDTTENRDKLQINRQETEEIGNVGRRENVDIDQGLMIAVILLHFVPKAVEMRLTIEKTDTVRDTRRDNKIPVKEEITLTEKGEIEKVGHENDKTAFATFLFFLIDDWY